jgi:general secretion pathway protein A
MYEQFFGLTEEPFRLTPDPRYLYLSTKHAEALAHLRLGLTESSGFVCITGEVGAGKTTLLRTFIAELGPDVVAAYAFVPPLSAIDLLLRICREFGVTPASERQSDILDALHAYLLQQQSAGRLCVVVLDEAQALSIELLEQVRLLLNFETPTEKLLRIVLVGQPQLRKLLLHPDLAQLNQRITLRWHLGSLSYRQSCAYVRHRLAVASGGRAADVFTRPALHLLHRVAGGVPRLINMIGHRAMLAAFVERQPRVGRHEIVAAYRELQAVPLPGTLTSLSRAGVVAAGLAVGATIFAVGAPRIDWLTPVVGVGSAESARPPVCTDACTTSDVAAAIVTPPPDAPVHAAPLAASELAERLRALDPAVSVRRSTETLLAEWAGAPLAADEQELPDALASVAWRRGLEALTLTGNVGMLRVLGLPAQLAVRLPGQSAPRFVTLTGVAGSRLTLDVDGVPIDVEADALAAVWSGQARILWRDHDVLGPVLARGASGPAVLRLQALLGGLGLLTTRPTGSFDGDTEAAVKEFQRLHHLDSDGRVGPFTGIVLYSAAGNHQQPRLEDGARGIS